MIMVQIVFWLVIHKMVNFLFQYTLSGLENEPPPPGVDGEEKKKDDLEEGETKEEKNGEFTSVFSYKYADNCSETDKDSI